MFYYFGLTISSSSSFLCLSLKLDFLSSNVMHGEGNLVGHLVIIGYKVSFQQVSHSIYILMHFFNCIIYHEKAKNQKPTNVPI